jgi:hypothetical protein
MNRKLCLSLLWSILLLLAQQAAVLHEIGHWNSDFARGANQAQTQAQAHAQPQGQDKQQLPGTACEKCVVFAHFAGAVSPDLPEFAQPLLAYDFNGQETVSQRSADSPTARSRGPPILL